MWLIIWQTHESVFMCRYVHKPAVTVQPGINRGCYSKATVLTYSGELGLSLAWTSSFSESGRPESPRDHPAPIPTLKFNHTTNTADLLHGCWKSNTGPPA